MAALNLKNNDVDNSVNVVFLRHYVNRHKNDLIYNAKEVIDQYNFKICFWPNVGRTAQDVI